MKITFWGAAQEVTGSMHQVTTGGKQYILDCGMYQGRRKDAEQLNRNFPFPPQTINAVMLSHAHIDHSGNLPLLVKNGFNGPIYSTPASIDLCRAMLSDTAHIQEQDAKYLARHARPGDPPVVPLYTQSDVDKTLPLFRPVPYYTETQIAAGLTYKLFDAGHMLGSSTMVLESEGVRLAFSGDVGRPGLPIIRDPDPLPPVDYLIMESTYGDRVHDSKTTVIDKLADVVNRTLARGGRLIVPAFAVGRVQQLVLLLHQLANEKRIPKVPMFVDSPLAVNVTEVYRAHPECFDDETIQFLAQGDPFGFGDLQYIRDSEDSKKLNTMKGSFIVISPSGMCEAGRVLHHLKNNVEDSRNTVLITGYQAPNTLGSKLLAGMPQVNILNQPCQLRAEVASLQALSGHADRDELISWIAPIAHGLKKVFLVHGEANQAAALAATIHKTYGIDAIAAQRGTTFELSK